MPRPRIQVHLISKAGQTQLDLARTDIEAKFLGADIFDRPHNWKQALDVEAGRESNIMHIRLNRTGQADMIWTELQALLLTLRLNVTGKMTKHLCSHGDADEFDCQSDPRSGYQEVTI